MKCLNNPDATVQARLKMLDHQTVGDVLYVNRCPGKDAYFAIATLSTVTSVDHTEEPHLGALILEEIFEDIVYQNYSINLSTQEHMIIVATGANTREPG